MKIRYKVGLYLVLALAIGLGGYHLGQSTAQVKTEIVTKVQERERVRTIIEERPDGSKTTTIDRVVKKDATQNVIQTKPIPKKWLISASRSLYGEQGVNPTWGTSIQRRIILDLYMGVYARTDKEIGVILTYQF